jgi:membrane fusion protein (multidrug efflux system)
MQLKNLAIALSGTLLMLTLTACGVGEAKITATSNDAEITPLPVETISPNRMDILAKYHTTTTITADAEAPVIARVSGEIVEILVEEGDMVVAGQILARLDGERLRLRMLQAQANLEKVRKEHQRFIRLHEKGLVSASVADGLGYDLNALQAAYELQRLDYDYTYVRAPISGVVSARKVKIGQQVEVNEGTFQITDTRKLVAYLQIPQTELQKFAAGQRVNVQVDAMPEMTFDATIARISPTIDARNGTFRVTAMIDNHDMLIAPGMFGRFDIAYEKHVDALVIPLAALIEEDSRTVVYVVSEGAAERRSVQIGIRSGDSVEILSGLEADDSIVVTGQGGLRDGSRVLASVETASPISG